MRSANCFNWRGRRGVSEEGGGRVSRNGGYCTRGGRKENGNGGKEVKERKGGGRKGSGHCP